MDERRIVVLSVGEALIDLISNKQQGSLETARHFHMYPGGEATNVALNMARLGAAAALVARVGDDHFGSYLREHLASAGVQTDNLRVVPQMATTLVVVTRQQNTPDFAVYRGADAELLPDDMPLELLPATALVHASAFALSREPSSSSVMAFVQQAHEAGCLISFDPNYHPRVWQLSEEPQTVLAKLYPYVSITKPSLDDCTRLFGPGQSPEDYAARFLEWGARQVVLTMGAAGVLHASAEEICYYPTPREEVVDVTGAGDAFWAGLLLATLDGYGMSEAIRVAQAVAALKVRQIGPLSHSIDREALYASLDLQKNL